MYKFLSWFKKKQHGESGTACRQVLGDFEIENLADNFSSCLKTDKQRWLISEPKEIRDILIAKVQKIYILFKRTLSVFLFSYRHVVPTPCAILTTHASAKSTVTMWLKRIVKRKKSKKIKQMIIAFGYTQPVRWQLLWQTTIFRNFRCSLTMTIPFGFIPTP